MRYPCCRGHHGVHTEHYTNCNGTLLKLTDSDIGSEQYSSSDYYVWSSRTGGSELLFIFPTRVNITTITLHYYSDSVRGLPWLKFFAVPDDYDSCDGLSANYNNVNVDPVPPGGETAGRRNLSINFDLTTKKVVMYKYSSDTEFAVSEEKFFTVCNCKCLLYVNVLPCTSN